MWAFCCLPSGCRVNGVGIGRHQYDLPPGQTIAASLALVYLVVIVLRWLRDVFRRFEPASVSSPVPASVSGPHRAEKEDLDLEVNQG